MGYTSQVIVRRQCSGTVIIGKGLFEKYRITLHKHYEIPCELVQTFETVNSKCCGYSFFNALNKSVKEKENIKNEDNSVFRE